MKLALPPAHRLARINYPPRTFAFAFTFLVFAVLWAERGFEVWELFFAALSFLVYPHLAYFHACIAPDSKRAELNNLYADSILVGIWAAQVHFALWPTAAVLAAVSLNSAANGGLKRLFRGVACFAAAAAAWGAAMGVAFKPDTGPVVTGLSVFGILSYLSWIGVIVFAQNKNLLRARNAQRSSEAQFRFIAENVGDLVSVVDTGGRFLYASVSHEKHFDPDSVGSGADWLYTYLRSFYRDESRPTGWNNVVFANVGMPHVLWELQGDQILGEDHKLKLVKPGKLSAKEYDVIVADLVAYLKHMGEPMAEYRKRLGVVVLIFLAVFFVFAYALKREYWKDIH